jgi:hypothetical protein
VGLARYDQSVPALLFRFLTPHREQTARGALGASTDSIALRIASAAIEPQLTPGRAGLDAAHPVAVAVEAGGGVVQTADPDDLGRLAAPYRTVVIEPLARSKGSLG